MELVGVPRHRSERGLDLGERARIEQIAQLLLAEQLAQELAIEGERLRAPLGGRRVVLVHVGRDVVEHQRRGHRRGGRRLDLDEIELARLETVEDPAQSRKVEDVLQALPIRLEDDREGAVAPRDLEQALGLEPLLPERRPLARPPPRDEERPCGVLAEARAEERCRADLLNDEILELARLDEQVGEGGRGIGIGEVQRDPVVRPERLHLEPESVANARGERHRPRRVHPAAERRQQADAPVADLVAEALDDDRAVGRERREALLLSQERQEVLRRPGVEVVLLAQSGRRALVGRERRAHATPRRSSRPARTAAQRPRPSRTGGRRERPARARRARGRA